MAKFVVLAQLGGGSTCRPCATRLKSCPRRSGRTCAKSWKKRWPTADKRSAAAGQAADRLCGTLDRIYHTKVIDTPAEGAFQTTLVMLQALDVM